MNFEEYSAVLSQFENGKFTSIKDDYNDICHAQDRLIAEMSKRGAEVAGWKVVEDDGVLILSPIFDFQVMDPKASTFSQEQLLGVEIELCFAFHIPDPLKSNRIIEEEMDQLQPLAAIELLRQKISSVSHLACDFYFNYGILVAKAPVENEFTLHTSNKSTANTFMSTELRKDKLSMLRLGVKECLRRGFVDREYFFMTGNLNGLLDTHTCLGENTVTAGDEAIIHFTIR